ncbi:MAG: ABC transporter permease, partial [Candidatus Pacebacteria bacterium]|nr:ABC transporter permease [Candidatus Paceibacterota bacterium]
MKVTDLFYISVQNIKTKKSRFLFTILGVSIGVGAVLFLVSLGLGLQRNLHESITTTDSLLTLDIVTQEENVITLTTDSLDKIAKIPGVELVSPQVVLPSQVFLPEKQLTSESTFNIIDKDFFRLSGMLPKIEGNTSETNGPNIIVNSSVAEIFNLTPEEILGQQISFVVYLPKILENDNEEIVSYSIDQTFTIAGIIPEAPGSPSQVYIDIAHLPDLPILEYQFAKVK